MADTLIEVDLGHFEEDLAQVVDALHLERYLDEAGAVLLNRQRTRYLAEVDPDGVAWVPSAAGLFRKSGGYTYSKGGRWTGTGTMFETGDLFHSIQLVATGPNERVIQAGAENEAGENYGIYAQFGLGQEERRFLGVSDDDFEVIAALFIARIKENIA